MRGDRDSELAAVIRDTDMIDSTMAGQPFQVGRFAHELRVRLMREHLGIDVDQIVDEQMADLDAAAHGAAPDTTADAPVIDLSVMSPTPGEKSMADAEVASHGGESSTKLPSASSQDGNLGSSKGITPPTSSDFETPASHHRTSSRSHGHGHGPKASLNRLGGTLKKKILQQRPRPKVDANMFADPLLPEFFEDMWVASAHHNVSFISRLRLFLLNSFADRHLPPCLPRHPRRQRHVLETVPRVSAIPRTL